MTGSITGHITDADTQEGIFDVNVYILSEGATVASTFTDTGGGYTVSDLEAGTYTVSVLNQTYKGQEADATVSDDTEITVDFALTAFDMTDLADALESDLQVFEEVTDKTVGQAMNLGSSSLNNLTQIQPTAENRVEVLFVLSQIYSIINDFVEDGSGSDLDVEVEFGAASVAADVIYEVMGYLAKFVDETSSIAECYSAYTKIESPTISDAAVLGQCVVASMIIKFSDVSEDIESLEEVFSTLQEWYATDPSLNAVKYGKVLMSTNAILLYLNQ